MAKVAGDLSVSELEKLLDRKKSKLQTLTKKRDKLQRDLANVEKRIGALQGRTTATVSSKARRKPAKRPKNRKPLSDFVVDVLGRNKKGLPLGTLSKKVLDAGYKSNSKNFKNVLYQCLYKSKQITHDEKTKLYQLK